MNKNAVILGLSVVTALATGGVVGFFLTKKLITDKLQTEYETALAKELEDTKTFYARTYKKDEFETVEGAAKALGHDGVLITHQAREAMVGYGARTISNVVKKNIFEEVAEQEPSAEELATRNEDIPYVISASEFSINDTSYPQDSLTMYSDGVLVDSQEDIVVDIEDLIGSENLQKFGHMSGNPDIVYVRNDVKQIEFEISRSKDTYGEVTGLTGG